VTSLHVPFDPVSVSAVRSALVDELASLEGVTAERVDAAALVLSELLSNSIRHAEPLDGRGVLVRWRLVDEGLRISVSDGGGVTQPRRSDALGLATQGRGLAIVTALARRWWRDLEGSRSTVHAVLDL
jgi:anti-sigma regulatory factor (Ser/Thr protein kinase)